MDSKVMKLAIGVFAALIAVILIIVYASNADKINSFLKGSAIDSSDGSMAELSAASNGQIGNNLQGFMAQKDFFDDPDYLGKAMEIAAARKRGNSEQLLRYWVTVQLCSGEMAADTVQKLKQYEDPALRDYLETCPKGKGKMALREALAVYMHKAPETVRKDLEVSVTNSSSKVQKLLFQAATELKQEGKL